MLIHMQYIVTEDKNARHRNLPIILQERTTYGQLQRLVHVQIKKPVTNEKVHVVLAVICECKLEVSSVQNMMTTIGTDGTFGPLRVVNVTKLLGLAARVLIVVMGILWSNQDLLIFSRILYMLKKFDCSLRL